MTRYDDNNHAEDLAAICSLCYDYYTYTHILKEKKTEEHDFNYVQKLPGVCYLRLTPSQLVRLSQGNRFNCYLRLTPSQLVRLSQGNRFLKHLLQQVIGISTSNCFCIQTAHGVIGMSTSNCFCIQTAHGVIGMSTSKCFCIQTAHGETVLTDLHDLFPKIFHRHRPVITAVFCAIFFFLQLPLVTQVSDVIMTFCYKVRVLTSLLTSCVLSGTRRAFLNIRTTRPTWPDIRHASCRGFSVANWPMKEIALVFSIHLDFHSAKN